MLWVERQDTHLLATTPHSPILFPVAPPFPAGVAAPDRTIGCWGSDKWGQWDAPTGTFTAIAVGRGHSCGLRADGTAACWGLAQ